MKVSANSDIRVVELFAGVGGFRVGLERCSERFKTIWANQWEPGQAGQWAYKCYSKNFGEDSHCVNADIATVIDQVPPHDLLVGGFPCQDYSVASTGAKGIEGKKGVLWWSIYKIIQKNHPNYVLLENVDRLLKSPASQRGRDFGIILKCLQEEGYGVEWRVINAADYGCVQRRRRTFIFAFKNTTKQYERMTSCFSENTKDGRVWLMQEGFFAHAFPVHSEVADSKKVATIDFNEYTDTVDVTNRFRAAFYNSGVLCNGKIFSLEAVPNGKEPMLLGEIVVNGDIDKSFFIEDEDLEVIRNDWKVLMDKIKAGQAHLISEGDTMYLAACPKGRNSQDTRSQPFSPIPAMKRAYSLKSSYMTQILRRYIFGDEPCEKIIKDPAALRSTSFEDWFSAKVRPYTGMSRTELKAQLDVKTNAKNLNELLVSAMLGVKGHLSKTEEFQKAGIQLKAITVEVDGSIEQNVSFPKMDFCAMMNETWEESTLYNLLAPTKFLFVIFQKTEDGECYFQRIKFWNIPADDLEEVHRVWQRTVDTLREGVHIWKDASGRNRNNLPKASESRVAHVRPHGRDSTDTAPLPTGGSMTKQCFWLNNSYVAEQIKEV